MSSYSLRAIDDSFPSIKSRAVNLIRVREGDNRQSSSVGGKRELLRGVRDTDLFIATWMGRWSCDAFAVTKERLEAWQIEILR